MTIETHTHRTSVRLKQNNGTIPFHPSFNRRIDMKTHTKTLLAVMTATSALAAGSADAALIVTGGDFESPALSNGQFNNLVGNWNDDSGSFTSYVYKNSSQFDTASALLAIENTAGWVHQSLGTRSSGEDTLSVTFDAFERSAASRTFATTTFELYAGAFTPTGDTDDVADEGLTSLGTIVVSAADLFTTPSDPSGVNRESNIGYTAGAVDLTGVALGTEVWLRISSTDVVQNSSSVLIDNLSVSAVPEPGSLALMGLGGLCMMKRRRRA